MIIAVDFDGTTAKWAKYPEIGEPVPYAREVLNRLHASGHEIIIWTCRGVGALGQVRRWMEKNDIKYHHINVQGFTTAFDPSPKIIADLYIDDKAIGCPLIPNTKGKPYVDWLAVQLLLQREGYYTIPLPASDHVESTGLAPERAMFEKGELYDE
jgi:hypothetical protein